MCVYMYIYIYIEFYVYIYIYLHVYVCTQHIYVNQLDDVPSTYINYTIYIPNLMGKKHQQQLVAVCGGLFSSNQITRFRWSLPG